MLLGAIEAGGTKMVCAIGDENGNIFKTESYPTLSPKETIPSLVEFFKDSEIEVLGIACFGPIDLHKDSSTYGYITSTPKLAWQNYDMLGAFKELNVPLGFDSDVNGSVLGEVKYGIGRDVDSCLYLTVGTGVGAGIYLDGKLVHGMLHPEAGHILLARRSDDDYSGCCPFHSNCLESLASGSSIKGRYGVDGKSLKQDDKAWDLIAYYIAQALVNYTLTVSPQRIILGGGVMHQKQLLAMIRNYYKQFMNNYIQTKEVKDLDTYIVLQSLDDKQGVLGALALAYEAYKEESNG